MTEKQETTPEESQTRRRDKITPDFILLELTLRKRTVANDTTPHPQGRYTDYETSDEIKESWSIHTRGLGGSSPLTFPPVFHRSQGCLDTCD